MIKPNELRQNNYVLYKRYANEEGVVRQIHGIVGGFGIGRVYFNKNDNETAPTFLVEGIPITPEILEKAGWERKEIIMWRTQENQQPDHIYYIYPEWKSFLFNVKSAMLESWPKDLLKTDIKYVHQLQNIYAALSGEELSIKL